MTKCLSRITIKTKAMYSYKIIRLGNGWYDFKHVPQNSYIKIHGLNCGSDEAALARAKELCPHGDFYFVEVTK